MSAALVPPRTRKPRGQGQSRHAEILDAAKRIFLEEGVEHATMRRIAGAVGVSATALYVYFPDKDAILQSISEAMFIELLAAHRASQQTGGAPLGRFRAGLQAYVALGLARPDEYRLTFSIVRSKVSGRIIPAADQSFEVLQAGITELIAAGIFRPNDPTLVAEAIWAALHGLVVLLLDHYGHIVSDHKLLADTMLNAIIRGFSTEVTIVN